MLWLFPVALGLVQELDKASYESFLKDTADDEWVLLDFYAPWCGHCKRLSPVLDELSSKRPWIRVGKIDATKHKLMPVDGYPMLRFGKDLKEWKGGRDLESLETLDDRLRGPVFRGLDTTLEPHVVFVGNGEEFENVARERYYEANFAQGDGIYIYPDNYPFPGGDLKQWVKKHNVPLWSSPLLPGTFRKISKSRLVVACVVDPDVGGCDEVEEGMKQMGDLREFFAGGQLDGVKWHDYVATFDALPPSVVVIDLKNDRFWNRKGDEDVLTFLRNIHSGKLKPRYQGWRGFPGRARKFYFKYSVYINAVLLIILLLTLTLASWRRGNQKNKKNAKNKSS